MKPYWQNSAGIIFNGHVLEVLRDLPDESVHCCVTSPPYWGLRDYGVDGQIGLEKTPDEFVARMVEVFREVRRVLRGDGTLWLNLLPERLSEVGTGRIKSGRNTSPPPILTQHQWRREAGFRMFKN